MVKVGDKLFHWRFGELLVMRLEKGKNKTYIHAKVADLSGVAVDHGHAGGEKVFVESVVGYWLHNDIYGALLRNCNNNEPYPKSLGSSSEEQGQAPLAMKFPILGNLLHKLYNPILEEKNLKKKEIDELEKKKNIKDSKIKNIDKTYQKHKLEYESIVDEIFLLKDIENTIRNYMINKKIEGQELELLQYIIKDCIKEDFEEDLSFTDILGKSYEEGINVLKTKFKDDNKYNDFIKSSEQTIREIIEDHSKNLLSINEKLDDIYNTVPFASIGDLINTYKVGVKQVNMEEIQEHVDIEKEEEKKVLKSQVKRIISEIKAKEDILNEYNILDDENYILFD